MENEELVSILIPVYNRATLVGKAIECSINQTYKNIEIIIIDNCSNDDTWNVLQEYEKKDNRIRIYRNSENIGPVKNWIECAKKAKGKYIKILFSDDWMDLNWIEKSTSLLNSNDNIGLIYSSVKIKFSNDISLESDAAMTFHKDTIFNSIFFIYTFYANGSVSVSPGCYLFRRDDVLKNLKLNLPDSDIDFNINGAGADLLLILRTAYLHKKCAYIHNEKCYFLVHENSYSFVPEKNKFYYSTAMSFFFKQIHSRNSFFFKIIVVNLYKIIYRTLYSFRII